MAIAMKRQGRAFTRQDEEASHSAHLATYSENNQVLLCNLPYSGLDVPTG